MKLWSCWHFLWLLGSDKDYLFWSYLDKGHYRWNQRGRGQWPLQILAKTEVTQPVGTWGDDWDLSQPSFGSYLNPIPNRSGHVTLI